MWSPPAPCSKVNLLSETMPRCLCSRANAAGRFSNSSWRGGGRSFPKINAALIQSLRSGGRIKLSVSHLISARSSLYDPCVVSFQGIRLRDRWASALFLWTKSVTWCWFAQIHPCKQLRVRKDASKTWEDWQQRSHILHLPNRCCAECRCSLFNGVFFFFFL